ncbi:MAG: phosphatase PAP2 family protein [Chlorobiales bacterium]
MKFPLLFLLMIVVTTASAQSRSSLSHDISSSWQHAKSIYTSPFGYSALQWLTVASVLSLTAGSHFLDEPLHTFARTHQTPTLTTIFSIGEFYGNPICAGLIGGGLYLGGLSNGDASTRLTGRAVLESVLYASLLTQALKITVGRTRPYQNKGARDFHGFSWTNDQWSFPSGHTTIAFATSASLSVRLKRPAATVGLFALALLTTGQRIDDNQHWLSDTLFGAAIGTSIGLAVGNLVNEEEQQGGNLPSQAVQPIFSVQFPL